MSAALQSKHCTLVFPQYMMPASAMMPPCSTNRSIKNGAWDAEKGLEPQRIFLDISGISCCY